MVKEIQVKEQRVRDFFQKQQLIGLLLTKQHNFAWFTGGKDNHVVNATDMGVASLLITRDKKYCLTANIECRRIEEEELGGQGYEFRDYPWHDQQIEGLVKKLVPDGVVGSDTGLYGTKLVEDELAPLRYSLTPEEINRARELGKNTAKSMKAVCHVIQLGDTEHKIEAMLSAELLVKGIYPAVLLVAADERISLYRHPIPTNKKVKQYVMVVTCARQDGLIVAITRIVCFGKLPKELKKKHPAVAEVNATFINSTRAGRKVSTVLQEGISAYAVQGYPDEWQLHHQGGATGYLPREYIANPSSTQVVQDNQLFAWNPSITGTKVEDTILVTSKGNEILTRIDGWPEIEVEMAGKRISQADILVR